MTKSQKLVNGGLLVLLGGGVALVAVSLRSSETAEASVRTARVERGVVRSTVSASGNVQAATSIDVSFSASGTLKQLSVKVGQRVKAGQVLGRIDATSARSGVDSARVSLDQARAQLAADRQSASAQVASAQASLAAARRSLADTKRLNRDQIAAAEQQVKQAASQVAADKTALGPNPQSMTSAQASITNAQASLAQAESSLSYTQALNERQLEAAQHDVDAASATLASDLAKLARDQATELSDCGVNSPVITSSTPAQCRSSAQTVISDQAAEARDRTALLSAQDALAQLLVRTAQSLDQAKAQRASAATALDTAKKSLAALKTANAQTLARDTQSLASARMSLTQARTKAAQSVNQAQAQVRSAEFSLANAKASLATLDGVQVSQDEARIRTAEIQLATAQAALRDTALRAPAAGTVSAISVSIGQLVSGGAAGAFTLTDLQQMQVLVSFPETDAAKIRIGQAATVTLDALAGKQLAAHVVAVALTSTIVDNVVTYSVTLALDRTQEGIKPGMTAAVEVVVAQRDGVLNVPSAAVSSSGGAATVTVLRGEEQVSVPVVTGLAGDSTTEIAGGLNEGDLVVLPTVRISAGTATNAGFPRGGLGGLGGTPGGDRRAP